MLVSFMDWIHYSGSWELCITATNWELDAYKLGYLLICMTSLLYYIVLILKLLTVACPVTTSASGLGILLWLSSSSAYRETETVNASRCPKNNMHWLFTRSPSLKTLTGTLSQQQLQKHQNIASQRSIRKTNIKQQQQTCRSITRLCWIAIKNSTGGKKYTA